MSGRLRFHYFCDARFRLLRRMIRTQLQIVRIVDFRYFFYDRRESVISNFGVFFFFRDRECFSFPRVVFHTRACTGRSEFLEHPV